MKKRDEAEIVELITVIVRDCRNWHRLGYRHAVTSRVLRELIFHEWETRNASKPKAAKYRSKAAAPILRAHRWLKLTGLIYDHAIPVNYHHTELLNLAEVTPETVRAVLLGKHGPVAGIITIGENFKLTSEGLAHRMPDDWDGADPLARYKFVGIEMEENIFD
ncbi:MAG TPA: hypothetical protein VGF62_10725 [Rhizomicrobium sp.]|jgi:hypothetical protein